MGGGGSKSKKKPCECKDVWKCGIVNSEFECGWQRECTGDCDCIAGDVKVVTTTTDNAFVKDLSPGDLVRGKDTPDGESKWCTVITNPRTVVNGTAHGPTTMSHGVVTGLGRVAPARYEVHNGKGNLSMVNLTDGVVRFVDLYNPVTDCPIIVTADSKILLTSLSDDMLDDSGGVEVRFVDYLSVWKGLMDLTNTPGLEHLWNPRSYHSNASTDGNMTFTSKLPALATSILDCKTNHSCDRFETVADDIVKNNMEPKLAKIVKEKYPTPQSFTEVLVREQNITVTTTVMAQLAPTWFWVTFVVLLGVCVLVFFVGVVSWLKERAPKKTTTVAAKNGETPKAGSSLGFEEI